MMPVGYESVIQKESNVCPGVTYRVARMSFGRRIELMRLVREITMKFEFQEAAGEAGRMAAAILSSEVDRLYVGWGLKAVDGLLIDGLPATPQMLLLEGPEDLLKEALEIVRAECGLSDQEKKT
jgi:hypothetical protein